MFMVSLPPPFIRVSVKAPGQGQPKSTLELEHTLCIIFALDTYQNHHTYVSLQKCMKLSCDWDTVVRIGALLRTV